MKSLAYGYGRTNEYMPQDKRTLKKKIREIQNALDKSGIIIVEFNLNINQNALSKLILNIQNFIKNDELIIFSQRELEKVAIKKERNIIMNYLALVLKDNIFSIFKDVISGILEFQSLNESIRQQIIFDTKSKFDSIKQKDDEKTNNQINEFDPDWKVSSDETFSHDNDDDFDFSFENLE